MKYTVNNIEYDVVIEKKNNKNTYLRVKDNNTLFITTNYFVTKKQILKFLSDNEAFIIKSQNKINKHKELEDKFILFGNEYNIILMPNKKVEIIGNNIYTKDIKTLNNWLKREIKSLYLKRLDMIYNKFSENIPYPSLKIRKMTTRWGVCNTKLHIITLNTELIRYDITKLDYVIVHELSHLVYPNHSKDFWSLVSKYCSDYKKIRKELKD